MFSVVRRLVFLGFVALAGCTLDPRPQALQRGVNVVRKLLADPRLYRLADRVETGAFEQRLVAAMFSAAAKEYWPRRQVAEYDFSSQDPARLPGRIVYCQDAEVPWSVAVKADSQRHQILLLGYGMSLDQPLLREAVAIASRRTGGHHFPTKVVRTHAQTRPGSEGVTVTIQRWGVGRADCVWGALTQAGWKDTEIVDRGLVQQVARRNRLQNANLVFAGTRLWVPSRPGRASL